MRSRSPFDVIAAKAWETVEFHCVTHQITLTEDERDAVQLGLSSAVHVAIEQSGARVLPPAECDGCLCPTEHDGDYGSSGHAGPCPPHTCDIPPGGSDA